MAETFCYRGGVFAANKTQQAEEGMGDKQSAALRVCRGDWQEEWQDVNVLLTAEVSLRLPRLYWLMDAVEVKLSPGESAALPNPEVTTDSILILMAL